VKKFEFVTGEAHENVFKSFNVQIRDFCDNEEGIVLGVEVKRDFMLIIVGNCGCADNRC
jgi:hypothetical protein